MLNSHEMYRRRGCRKLRVIQQIYMQIVHQSLVKQLRVHGGLSFLQSLRLLLKQLMPQLDLEEGIDIQEYSFSHSTDSNKPFTFQYHL